MKEYGGYLPLELGMGNEYYDEWKPVRLNSGRTAIVEAVLDSGCSEVYLPVYLCSSVEQALKDNKITYFHYNIGEDFLPVDIDRKEEESDRIVVVVNYYGLLGEELRKKILDRYERVIFDNTQAFFAVPIPGAYNVYSCRKFLGVADGAYLIKEGLSEEAFAGLEQDSSYERSVFLIKCMEEGTNAAYGDNLMNEEQIEKAGLRRMSLLTRRILQSADYEAVKRRRTDNFAVFHESLRDWNELKIHDMPDGPMIYPLLVRKEDLRQRLLEKKIYVPQWWKYILEHKGANEFEKYLSEYLIPLPVDQRYGERQIKEMLQIIMAILEGRALHGEKNTMG